MAKRKAVKKRRSLAKDPVCQPMHTYEYYLMKISRVCAWALLAFIVLYVFSGFGITKSGMIYKLTGGLINKGTALNIHHLLVLPMALAFIGHTLIAVRFAMIRWNVKNKKVLNYVFLGIGILLFALTCWIYFV